jgi:hypothetical protein
VTHHHRDPSATALAHGCTKAETIELTRRTIERATQVMARRQRLEAARRERQLAASLAAQRR